MTLGRGFPVNSLAASLCLRKEKAHCKILSSTVKIILTKIHQNYGMQSGNKVRYIPSLVSYFPIYR